MSMPKTDQSASRQQSQYNRRDFVFYLFDENGEPKVFITMERPLTPQEFQMIDENLFHITEAMRQRAAQQQSPGR